MINIGKRTGCTLMLARTLHNNIRRGESASILWR
jgi:hypothetical protein